jgi:hypothetical protein
MEFKKKTTKKTTDLARHGATLTFYAGVDDPPLSPLRLYQANVTWAPV